MKTAEGLETALGNLIQAKRIPVDPIKDERQNWLSDWITGSYMLHNQYSSSFIHVNMRSSYCNMRLVLKLLPQSNGKSIVTGLDVNYYSHVKPKRAADR